jgi:hypothetical protein
VKDKPEKVCVLCGVEIKDRYWCAEMVRQESGIPLQTFVSLQCKKEFKIKSGICALTGKPYNE